MATSAIGPVALVPGLPAVFTVTGPVGWQSVDFLLDGAAQVGTVTVTVEQAPDGVTFQPLAAVDCTGPALEGLAQALVTTLDIQVVAGAPVPGDTPQVRVTVAATQAFASTGGHLIVT